MNSGSFQHTSALAGSAAASASAGAGAGAGAGSALASASSEAHAPYSLFHVNSWNLSPRNLTPQGWHNVFCGGAILGLLLVLALSSPSRDDAKSLRRQEKNLKRSTNKENGFEDESLTALQTKVQQLEEQREQEFQRSKKSDRQPSLASPPKPVNIETSATLKMPSNMQTLKTEAKAEAWVKQYQNALDALTSLVCINKAVALYEMLFETTRLPKYSSRLAQLQQWQSNALKAMSKA